MTANQKNYLETLSRQAGFKFWTDAEKARSGKVRIGFGKSDASDLIDWLKVKISKK
jgi:hypothetical protein